MYNTLAISLAHQTVTQPQSGHISQVSDGVQRLRNNMFHRTCAAKGIVGCVEHACQFATVRTAMGLRPTSW